MSTGIPDLWPDEVAFADVVSPLTILRHQAPSAAGQQEFTAVLQRVIGSSRAKTAIHALIAKINDSGVATNPE